MNSPATADCADADDALVARCRADGDGGDPRAWDALFDRYYPVAARFIFQLSAGFSREDTEEICQETFLAVVRHLDDFDGRSAFQTWLLRIATNKAFDHRQKTRALKRGAGAEHLPLATAGANEDGERTAPEPPAPGLGPDAALLRAEDATLLRHCLDELGDPCREIIELRYYADLSYEEISAALRLNVKTVSSRLSKCLDRLTVLASRALPWHARHPRSDGATPPTRLAAPATFSNSSAVG
ncbi:MAG: sigma-70 family RNA polymerase sigma factor [Verrucomicrobia bacterium]|nr:sigma-70 family RNA polymerase sigma factor [Verrucomicrobiota bacterium]